MLYTCASRRGYRQGEASEPASKACREELTVDITSGTDFPDNLSQYDLVIQCGACMFNRKYVLSRIDRARTQHVPMTNYGVAIAHLTGILDKVSMP